MIKPILSLIIILFSVGFGFFYVKPEYEQVQSTRADLEQLAQTSQSAGEIKNIIAETKKSLNAIDTEDLARFDVFLPETLDGIRFANNLQHIGTANGLVLSGINVEQQKKIAGAKPATQPAPAGTINKTFTLVRPVSEGTSAAKEGVGSEKKYIATKVSFSFTTTYSGFLLFLNDLEKSLGLINITSLSFKEIAANADEKGNQKGLPLLYQFSIDIETYSLK